MKISQKSKEKKDKVKKKEIKKPKNEQVLTVAQEIKFARLLSGNDKKSRDKVLKTLKKWLLSGFEKKDVGPHSNFTMLKCKEDDFIRIWKGLFYGVWLSDKPLVQEDLCENIASILDLFPTEYLKHALLMFKAGLRVLATQWYGIDHHRMDKFLMLVRRCLRASLRCLLRCDWDLDSCKMYAETIAGTDGILAVETPQYARNATSMILHFIDCYLEEISKVSAGKLPGEALAELLRPLCALVGGASPALAKAARALLTSLVRHCELGQRYQHATTVWLKMGCPKGGPEALELVSDDDEQEDDERNVDEDMSDDRVPALDPRAGRVDVVLSPLPVPASLLANMLRDLLATASGKANKRVRICLQRFEQLARDEYPLRISTELAEESPTRGPKPREVIHSLQTLEKNLVTDSDELALRGLSRKHRKRLLAKSRSGQSIVEEVEVARQTTTTNATVGKWQVDSTEPETVQTKQDKTDKENKNKKRKNEEKVSKQHKKRKPNRLNGEVTDKPLKPDRHSNTDKLPIENKNHKNKSDIDDRCEQNKIKKHDANKINKHDNDKECEIDENNIKENGGCVHDNEIKKINIKKNKINEKQSSEKNIQTRNSAIEKKLNNKRIDKNNGVKTVLVNKVKHFQKQTVKTGVSTKMDTPKKVKFVLKNNSMQAPIDYYKSIRQSPSIPFDGSKQPSKTNLKPSSTPSPINPFFNKKLKLKY